jgi:hypothetical protein
MKNGIIYNPNKDRWTFFVNNQYVFSTKTKEEAEARVAREYSNQPAVMSSTGSATIEVPKSMFTVAERFEFIENFTKMVARGIIPSLVVTGSGGLGKTHTVTETLKKMGLKDDHGEVEGDFIFISGYSTPRNLYTTLFNNNGKIVVFDDTDSVFKDPIGANILKAALDSKERRVISWGAESKDDSVPSRFEFFGKVIFISNLTIEKFPQAILSRSMLADLTLNTEEKLERISQVFKADNKFEADDKNAVIKFLQENHSKIKDLNIRSAYNAIKMKLALGENWERMCLYSLTLN